MSLSPFAELPKIKIAKSGGLIHLERILGLRQDSHQNCSLDAVIISLDLEVSRDERAKILRSSDPPLIKELGIAIFDTRQLSSDKNKDGIYKLILTQHLSTVALSGNSRTSTFSETRRISQDALPLFITNSLRVKDSNASSPQTGYRNIVIVGHSIKPDLRIIQRLGIDIFKIAPVVTILDTHSMARDVLGTASTRLNGHMPINSFTLAAVLSELHCLHEEEELHNAGNDATYTLHALLRLAVRSGEARFLNRSELANLDRLTQLTVGGSIETRSGD